jgi:hypothetical protein
MLCSYVDDVDKFIFCGKFEEISQTEPMPFLTSFIHELSCLVLKN